MGYLVGILWFHLIKNIAMRKIHYLIAVFALFLIGGTTVTMIKAKDMVEVLMSLIGIFEGIIIFFIFERIDNKIKQKA